VTGPIQLVVTDLDGTLWGRSGVIHADTIDAMAQLEAGGMPVLAATARRPASARKALAANGLALPAVLFDGSLGRNLLDGTEFHRQAFDTTNAQAVLAAFSAADVEPCVNIVCEGDRDARFGQEPTSHPSFVAQIAGWSATADLADVVAEESVLSFQLAGAAHEPLTRVVARVGHLGACTIAADVLYGGFGMSVRPTGVDKWRGVEAFCAHHGIDPSAVLAVGDGANDVELLSHARTACAIRIGADVALAVADHVLDEPDAGGWAAVLDLVG